VRGISIELECCIRVPVELECCIQVPAGAVFRGTLLWNFIRMSIVFLIWILVLMARHLEEILLIVFWIV